MREARQSAFSAPGCRVVHRGRAPWVIEWGGNTLPTNLCADFMATEFSAGKTDKEERIWNRFFTAC